MANEKLTQQTELTTPAADDLVYIVDVSDTSDGAAGSSRKIQVSNLMKEAPVQPSDLTGYATTTYVDTEVGNEETARITADANLQANIDAVNTAVASLTTDDVTEATNLYYTDARVDARIAAASVTDLSDVTSAGSGAIITAAERTQISTNQTNIGINAGGIATNASNITALDAQVQTNSTDIGTLDSDLTTLTTRVTTAETNITSNDTDIAALNGRVTTNETDIAGLQTDLAALNLTDLNDTPATLGTAGQLLAVNATATATEWVNPATGGGDVTSVNGQTGVVVLDTDDVSEGTTNLYHTSARVDARIAAKIADTTLVSTINGESGDATGDVSLSTTEIPEGSNLYYTDTRVRTLLNADKVYATYPTTTITGNHALTSSDEQKMLICDTAAGLVVQIPTGLGRDAEVLVYQANTGGVQIQAGTGVTLRNTSGFQDVTAEQYAIIGLKQLGTTDVWVITGERKPV